MGNSAYPDWFSTIPQKAYYQFNTNRNLSNEAAVIIRNGLYAGVKKQKPFNMSIPVWSAMIAR
jgi:hypothetical protein